MTSVNSASSSASTSTPTTTSNRANNNNNNKNSKNNSNNTNGLNTNSNTIRLKMQDALSYLDQVKFQLEKQPEVYSPNMIDLYDFEYIKILIENNLYISNNTLRKCTRNFKLIDIEELNKDYSRNFKIYHRKNSLIYNVTSIQDKRYFLYF